MDPLQFSGLLSPSSPITYSVALLALHQHFFSIVSDFLHLSSITNSFLSLFCIPILQCNIYTVAISVADSIDGKYLIMFSSTLCLVCDLQSACYSLIHTYCMYILINRDSKLLRACMTRVIFEPIIYRLRNLNSHFTS